MDFFEALKNRHSYRGEFSAQPVPAENLKKIVEAGTYAPSGNNAQTTQFIIINDKNLIDRIHSLASSNHAIKTAPAFIGCIIDRDPQSNGFSFHLEDCAAATENMLLAITALGYASVWLDGWLRLEQRQKILHEWLKIPESKKLQILLPIGKPLQTPLSHEKLTFEQRACFNQYDLVSRLSI